MENIEVINFLTGSEARWETLVELSEQPQSFSKLREELDIPQSTLNRNLSKLKEEGWVSEDEDRTYHLTSLGTMLVRRVHPLEDVLTVVGKLDDHPDAFPLEEFGFDIARLADADWRMARENEPYKAINRVRAIFESGTKLRAFTSHYNPAYIDVSERVAEQPDGSVVGMVPTHQLDAAIEDEYFDLSQFRNESNVEFRVWEGDIDYGVAIVDDETVVYTGGLDGGMPSVMFESTDEEVVEWTKQRYEEIYEQSHPVR